MPLPLLFIGVATATGALGVGAGVKAGIDANTATKVNKTANQLVEDATIKLDKYRLACNKALTDLAEEKIFVLNSSFVDFLREFKKIKNVDFKEIDELDESDKVSFDEAAFEEMQVMTNYAGSLAGGTVAGTASGALVAFGAYGAAQAFACASTGTAIASLSGAAASNATLAFFGGGSLASGGLGMAGGTLVLGGLVAGPALMIMGLVAGGAAKKNLEKAYTNKAEAVEIVANLDAASYQCGLVSMRTYAIYNLIASLDSYFLPMIYEMEKIIKDEGCDYKQYKNESKKKIAICTTIASTLKTVLDTPLLTESGELTVESNEILNLADSTLEKTR